MFEGRDGKERPQFEYWVEVLENEEGKYGAVAHELMVHTTLAGTDEFHYEVRYRLDVPEESPDLAFQKTVVHLGHILEILGVTVFEAKRERRRGRTS